MLVHGDKLRWLAWLRLAMFTRSFRRKPAVLVFSIIALLFLLGVVSMFSIFLFFLLQNLEAPGNTELLYLVFTGMLLFWIMLPLLSYSTNEGLDVTKLRLFPLTRAELMCSLLFSSLFDIWTLLLFVLLGTIVVAWWMHSLALGLITLLVVVVFYMTMVSISQLILAALMRTLQSRRFRDISVIIMALFGSSCYLIQRFAIGANSFFNITGNIQHGGFSPTLQWLPSGMAAGAIRAAYQNNWGNSFALLGGLLLICGLALYLWQMVLERSITASETGASRRTKQRRQNGAIAPTYSAAAHPVGASAALPTARTAGAQVVGARVATAGWGSALRPDLFTQLGALVRKELTCFWRDPQLKVRMVQPLIYVAIFIIAPLLGNGSSDRAAGFSAQYTPFVSAAIVFLFMLTLSQNTLGIERESLTALFLFPIDRRRLLWGKNLAVFLMGLVVLVALMIICLMLARQPGMILPALVIGLSGMGVALGWGNFVSAYFPRYQPMIGRRGYQATGNQAQAGGCLNALMSIVITLVTIVTLAPVALGIGIPFFLNIPLLLVATIPLSLVYGAVLYVVLTNRSARRILETEPEILRATTRAQ